MLQSITKYYKVLQSIAKYCKVLQSITKTNLVHLLGPIFGIVIKWAGTFHSAGQSKGRQLGFGAFEHPIFMKLLPDHLWH